MNNNSNLFRLISILLAITAIVGSFLVPEVRHFFGRDSGSNSGLTIIDDYMPVSEMNQYTITFDQNFTDGGTSTQTFPLNRGNMVSETIPLNGDVPNRPGWTFICWNTQKDGNGNLDFYNDVNTTVSGDRRLYAVWVQTLERPVTYISLNPNWGGGNIPVVIQTFEQNEKKALDGEGIPTSRLGCTFVEWNESPDGSGKTFGKNAIVNCTINTTLYAIWSTEPHTEN